MIGLLLFLIVLYFAIGFAHAQSLRRFEHTAKRGYTYTPARLRDVFLWQNEFYRGFVGKLKEIKAGWTW